jgi:hypothetical protein
MSLYAHVPLLEYLQVPLLRHLFTEFCAAEFNWRKGLDMGHAANSYTMSLIGAAMGRTKNNFRLLVKRDGPGKWSLKTITSS